jgi:ornithine cyclodeaminase/alanine dehydrogenase-like protein (mu-crystallin family)
MIAEILRDKLETICLYDIRPIDTGKLDKRLEGRVRVLDSWDEVYERSDIFITCTVSEQRYINKPPKKGSLQLNVSLRDYQPCIMNHVQRMIVDEWEEVCRENTDIEMMHRKNGLQKDMVISLRETPLEMVLHGLRPDETVMFNPMGMSVFDIAIGWLYCQEAKLLGIGTSL